MKGKQKCHTKTVIKRLQNSTPCIFVWFVLISCNAVYYSIVWPKLVYLADVTTRSHSSSTTVSMAILLAVHVYLLLAILVNLVLSTFSDPGFLPQSKSTCELAASTLKPPSSPTYKQTSISVEPSFVVVNVFSQTVELKWCSVRTRKFKNQSWIEIIQLYHF